MVRNVSGGSKTKSRARKDVSEEINNNHIRLPECDLEKIAYVTKAFGGGRFEVQLEDSNKIHCIARGKHKGKNRRNNLISIGCLILIGLREWENPHKTSDLITIYTPYEIEKLKTNTSINLNTFPLEDINGIASCLSYQESNLIFTNSAQSSSSSENQLYVPTQKIPSTLSDMDVDLDIDIDDI